MLCWAYLRQQASHPSTFTFTFKAGKNGGMDRQTDRQWLSTAGQKQYTQRCCRASKLLAA